MIVKILNFFATNEIILGISSLVGIIGFIMTVIVSVRTAKISKILKHNEVASQFNKERLSYQRTFEGHRKSIVEDGIKSNKLLKDILQNIEEYRTKFGVILSVKERITLYMFSHLLRKESEKVNYNRVSNCLAILSGRLSKKEETRNG